MKPIALIILSSIFLYSCSSDQQLKSQITKVINENPQILTDVIEKNPVLVLTALQNASKAAQAELANKQQEEEKKALEATFDKPLKAEIRSDETFLGPKDAPLTLVTYSDFECPFCSRSFGTVKELMNKYKGKINFVYKHLPLSFHQQAMISAQYYEAIRLQSAEKAFAFHDEIYQNQSKLQSGRGFLDAVAKKVGADMTKLKKDIESKSVKDRIEQDIAEASGFGFQGTPGFLLNGIPVKGAYPLEHFVNIVQELQKRGKVQI